jgi:Zn-dependent alcohol dehydrogenase
MGIAYAKVLHNFIGQLNNLGKFDIEPVIGGTYKMQDFDKAFEALAAGASGKMLLIP